MPAVGPLAKIRRQMREFKIEILCVDEEGAQMEEGTWGKTGASGIQNVGQPRLQDTLVMSSKAAAEWSEVTNKVLELS